jgi:4-phospho-D-threonate 3-dehydrogenase / 4-phospho-D-erythronate 3-dehydrogenase
MSDPATKPLIGITMGDPCGVGPEIIVVALATLWVHERCIPVVIGDAAALKRAIEVCNAPLTVQTVASPEEARRIESGVIPLLEQSHLTEADLLYGRPATAAGDAVFNYIRTATRLCLDGRLSAMVTAPISKEAMNRAGHHYPGHTELLAELCGTDRYVMMLAGDQLRVSLVTIHEALRDVPGLLSIERILTTIRVTEAGVRRLTGIARPRLAVLSLNPHCGEGGMFGDEERNFIAPAIEAAQRDGIEAHGPLSADTLFHFARQGQYDGVVAMYHDQGLIPLKLLHFDDGVNITLGLPIIRTSVDHGTAYDLAGTGRASTGSLLAAIGMAVKMALSFAGEGESA